jgi:hypothetical protein
MEKLITGVRTAGPGFPVPLGSTYGLRDILSSSYVRWISSAIYPGSVLQVIPTSTQVLHQFQYNMDDFQRQGRNI